MHLCRPRSVRNFTHNTCSVTDTSSSSTASSGSLDHGFPASRWPAGSEAQQFSQLYVDFDALTSHSTRPVRRHLVLREHAHGGGQFGPPSPPFRSPTRGPLSLPYLDVTSTLTVCWDSETPPECAKLDPPWKCADRMCTTGQTWMARGDDSTRSLALVAFSAEEVPDSNPKGMSTLLGLISRWPLADHDAAARKS